MASATAQSSEDPYLAVAKDPPAWQDGAQGRRKQTQLALQWGHKNPITRSHSMTKPKGMVCSLFGFSFCLALPDISEMIDIHVSAGIKIFDT